MDNNSLAHIKWDCKYHLFFSPKYRRQVIYKDIKADIEQILGTLYQRKGVADVYSCSKRRASQSEQTGKPLLGLNRWS